MSKAIFIALVLSHGRQFLGYQAGVAVAVDLIWVAIFAAYLTAVRREPSAVTHAPHRVGSRNG